jgi:hypothetical protein
MTQGELDRVLRKAKTEGERQKEGNKRGGEGGKRRRRDKGEQGE